jgi:hypothetical protein
MNQSFHPWGVKHHLEYGINGDQDGAVFVVSAGEASPDENLFVVSVGTIYKNVGSCRRISVPLQCTSQVRQESDHL